MEIKDRFYDYLIKKVYTENKAKDYVTAINSISEKLGTDLWNINDIKIIENIEQTILSKNSEYNQMNTDGNEMYRDGLQRYKEFLEYMKINNGCK